MWGSLLGGVFLFFPFQFEVLSQGRVLGMARGLWGASESQTGMSPSAVRRDGGDTDIAGKTGTLKHRPDAWLF